MNSVFQIYSEISKMDVYVVLALVACITSSSAWEVSETVIAVANFSAELPCKMTARNQGDKLFILAWYRNGNDTAFYSRDLREGGRAVAPGGRYQLVEAEDEARLRIRQVQPSDAGVYKCLADFESSPSLKTFVRLNVIEPPQHLWVVQRNTTTPVTKATGGANNSHQVGPFYIGDTVHLFCIAFGGKPQPSVTWWSEQRQLESKTERLSEHRILGDVTYAPLRREDHGRVLTCLANNNKIVAPLAIDVIIDMYLPPELISVRSLGEDGGRASSENTLVLQCRVLGARPAPEILWRLGDSELDELEQNVTIDTSQRLVVSEISVSINYTWDEAKLTCCVHTVRRDADADEFTCAEPLPLTVTYPPVLQITVDGEVKVGSLPVIKGSNVTMNCTYLANPPAYQLIWFHEEDIMTTYEGNNNDTNFHPILEMTNVNETHEGVYACAAVNNEGTTHSELVILNITYPAYCEDESIAEYGVGANEEINITCKVKANPAPLKYGWVVMNEEANASIFNNRMPLNITETENATFLYTRPNDTAFSTIFCWGINKVEGNNLPETPCAFLITDHTVPRPPTDCVALKADQEITITCEKGHDGGLPQKFTFIAKSTGSEDVLVTITNLEPKFIIQDLSQEAYKFEIVATNEKGSSKVVEIGSDNIIDESADAEPKNAVANITTLALALCGGVLLIALAACGLVLCAQERPSSDLARNNNPPLCAYNTEETNCNDSDESECNVRRTESFRRAMTRYPSKNFDVRRTSSFHSARYLHDFPEFDSTPKHSDMLRHSASCRVHSMQNINRRRDMDNLCDHLVTHLPPEVNYIPITTNTFHTMPKKMRHKMAKEISDEASVITQTSDGFSLPPPPDEFGTYRSGTKIKDIPKPTPTYTAVRKNSSKRDGSKQQQLYKNAMSPMNTVGLPTVSGTSGVYSYPDEDGRQVTTNPFDDSS
ncbi:hypothetical protein MSG28_003472 [Choristoneura fumiferana]|uniref:Uncharacterized protein n=1 Tax=Choristoneura fumiferana TaxID=7141 RepID=A0ACC0KF18_CHOFU|nr:hypothetical protein MSG28_003472 [Choristoneura fumiferana]